MVLTNAEIDQLKIILTTVNSKTCSILKHLHDNRFSIDDFSNQEVELPGVYAFFILPKEQTNVADFPILWDGDTTIKKYSKVVKKRFDERDKSMTSPYTLYVGKSEKIGGRLCEHIELDKDKSTYSLKLKGRRSLFQAYEITYAFYEFKELDKGVPKEIVQFVITNIERQLRDKMNPWVGKQ